MAKVEIVRSLLKEIEKRFRAESHKVLDLIAALESNPKKGKSLGVVGEILIREIRYKKYRFYFLVDGQAMKVVSSAWLTDILLRFVRMSDKRHQQRTIEDIKSILRSIGPQGFT